MRIKRKDIPEDLEDLINFRVAGEERLASAHFSEDAPDGPHVDAGRVLTTAEQDLGGAVPERDDLVGVGPERDAKSAGQSKVGQLQVSLAVNQQVLGLEIAVQHTVAMAVAHTRAQLAHELLDHGLSQPQPVQLSSGAFGQRLAPAALADRQRFHVLLEVEVEEFEDEIELVAVGMDDIKETHDGRVPHLFEQRDLSDGGRRDTLIFGLEANLLQGNNAAAIVEVAGFVNNAIRAWSHTRISARCGNGGREGEKQPRHTFANFLEFLVVFHGYYPIR